MQAIFYKFFLKTHQQNRVFSLYYRGVFFCCLKIKCKQGVKKFAKHPNKMGIFLCIVEGVFWMVFSFGFHFIKIFSLIILKEVFVCTIYTRSTKFSAPCFRVYRQRIWKALILKIYDFWNENLDSFEWVLERISSRRFWSRIKGYDFRALKCPKTPSGKACRIFKS